MTILLVAVGGAAGSVARYLVGLGALRFAAASAFPFATILVNVLGCFLLGGVLALVGSAGPSTSAVASFRLLIITGFLGGFTTFSAFAGETVLLAREGALGFAVGNVVAHVVLSLLAVAVGHRLAAYFIGP